MGDHGSFTLESPPVSHQWIAPRSIDEWLKDGALTRDQRNFIESPSESIRLKGPAGSGKTLALELKALLHGSSMLERGETPRILFATHNWATAEQVTDDLEVLDSRGVRQHFTIAPLVQVIEEIRPLPGGVELLGSDPEEDRDLQLLLLRDAIVQFKSEEYLRFKSGCSMEFQSNMEHSDSKSNKVSLFESDLLNEFAVVLGGEGIQLQKSDEVRYLELTRQARWMTLNRSERHCVYGIYRRFMSSLMRESRITSDQFLLTSSQWFNGFEWGPLRRTRGFDFIFVDELHLFSSIERRILNHLSRDATKYPALYMSLDPNQSPTGRYGSFTEDRAFEESQDVVELRQIHRYSPQILELIKHINRTVPTEDFGVVWSVDIESSQSLAPAGPRPMVVDSRDDLTSVATLSFNEANKGERPNSRVAIIVMDDGEFAEFAEIAERVGERKQVSIVRDREDLGTVSRARRILVVGTPEALAGLQFDHVIVSGFAESSVYERNDSRRIDFLSKLYLAVSRSAKEVTFIMNSGRNGIPEVLFSAIEREVVTLREV